MSSNRLATPVTRKRDFQRERTPSRVGSPISPITFTPSRSNSPLRRLPISQCLNCVNKQLAISQLKSKKPQRDNHSYGGVLIQNPEQDKINAKRFKATKVYLQGLKKQIQERERSKKSERVDIVENPYFQVQMHSQEQRKLKQNKKMTIEYLKGLKGQIQDERRRFSQKKLKPSPNIDNDRLYVDNGKRSQIYSMYHETYNQIKNHQTQQKVSYFNKKMAIQKKREKLFQKKESHRFKQYNDFAREQTKPVKVQCQGCHRNVGLNLLSYSKRQLF